MPLTPAGRTVFCAIAALAAAGPALAEGGGGRGPDFESRPRLHRHAHARPLPPEVRYRDPRYMPPRRRAARLAPPDFLIETYLPRTTETPIYNEPPSRFPGR